MRFSELSYDETKSMLTFFCSCTENKTVDTKIDPDENTRLRIHYRLVVQKRFAILKMFFGVHIHYQSSTST